RVIDVDELVGGVQPLDRIVGGGYERGAVELARHSAVERVHEERGLAAARHAGDAGKETQRNLRSDVLEIVATSVDDLERTAGVARGPLLGRPAQLAGKIFAGP